MIHTGVGWILLAGLSSQQLLCTEKKYWKRFMLGLVGSDLQDCMGILIPLLAQCVGVYIFVVGPLPTYDYLASTHAVNAPRPSLFFTALPLPCIILNANWRMKMGEAWEQDWRLGINYPSSLPYYYRWNCLWHVVWVDPCLPYYYNTGSSLMRLFNPLVVSQKVGWLLDLLNCLQLKYYRPLTKFNEQSNCTPRCS